MKKSEENDEKFKITYAISLITQIGITVSVMTILFIGLGYWADGYFGTLPVFVIIGAIFSFILSMFSVYRLILPMMEKTKKEKKD
jgi:F0F1-type ATP synthase assembly protein I